MKIEREHQEISGTDFRFAIVVSRWNDALTSKLAAGAREALTEAGVLDDSISTYQVPGAFELPVACQRAIESGGDYDAVIALGVVIRGETPHFDYVAGQAAAGILQVSLNTGVPVMFGVITADTMQQAIDRTGEKADNKGYEAARSAMEMVALFREMDRGSGSNVDKVIPHVAG